MIALAAAMTLYPDALRADLQRVYGIDLDHAMAGEHTAGHVASLVACMPPGSAMAIAQNEDAVWSLEAKVLAEIRNLFADYLWALVDKRKRGKRPAHIGPSWMRKEHTRTLEARVLSIEDLMEELNKPRTVSANGQ